MRDWESSFQRLWEEKMSSVGRELVDVVVGGGEE